MAAHARLKNEFTEDEKYHNLMRWLNYVRMDGLGLYVLFNSMSIISGQWKAEREELCAIKCRLYVGLESGIQTRDPVIWSTNHSTTLVN